MKIVKLKILAKDIKTTNYVHSNGCAITKALQLAGYLTLRDCGSHITSGNKIVANDEDNEPYRKMSDKVIKMYKYCTENFDVTNRYGDPIEPQDFTVELELDIE